MINMKKALYIIVFTVVVFFVGAIYFGSLPNQPRIVGVYPQIVNHGEDIVITGADFYDDMVLYLNGAELSGFLRLSDTEVHIPFEEVAPIFPRHFLPDATVNITVVNPGWRSVYSNEISFALPGEVFSARASALFIEPSQPEEADELVEVIVDYLQLINADNLTTVIIASRDVSRYLCSAIISRFEELGLTQTPEGLPRHAYAAIISGGEVVFEQVGSDNLDIITHNTTINDMEISLASAGRDAIDAGYDINRIMINGRHYTTGTRGFNIVVFDNDQGHVVDSVNIDTGHGNRRFRRYHLMHLGRTNDLVDYLQNLPTENTITLMVAHTDTSRRFNVLMERQFLDMGITTTPTGSNNRSYAAIISDGEVVFQGRGRGNSRSLIAHETVIDGVTVAVSSSTQAIRDGNLGETYITINGVQYAVLRRGLNIVVFDKILGEVVDSVSFDTNSGLDFFRRG